MAFTLAHPSAAIPLARPLGRWGVLSALIIGSVAPDLWYFLPFDVDRTDSHSVAGLFWFCLPVSLTLYVVFHALLKRPALGLLPASLAKRLAGFTVTDRLLPAVPWAAVMVSVLAGAGTHLVWDAFTHYNGGAVASWPALRAPLLSIGSYELRVFTVLQYASTLVGIVLLCIWLGRALKRAPVEPLRLPIRFSFRARLLILAGLLAAAAWGGASGLWHAPSAADSLVAARVMVRSAIGGAGSGFAVAVLAYGLLWQLWAWRVRR